MHFLYEYANFYLQTFTFLEKLSRIMEQNMCDITEGIIVTESTVYCGS